jgi:hypothetical protein
LREVLKPGAYSPSAVNCYPFPPLPILLGTDTPLKPDQGKRSKGSQLTCGAPGRSAVPKSWSPSLSSGLAGSWEAARAAMRGGSFQNPDVFLNHYPEGTDKNLHKLEQSVPLSKFQGLCLPSKKL